MSWFEEEKKTAKKLSEDLRTGSSKKKITQHGLLRTTTSQKSKTIYSLYKQINSLKKEHTVLSHDVKYKVAGAIEKPEEDCKDFKNY